MLNWVVFGLVFGVFMDFNLVFVIVVGVGGVLILIIGVSQLCVVCFVGDEFFIEIDVECFWVCYYLSRVFCSVVFDVFEDVEWCGGVLEFVGKNGERQVVLFWGFLMED